MSWGIGSKKSASFISRWQINIYFLDSTALKIAKDGWSDNRIVGTISKVPLPAGSYPASFEIVVRTKDKPPKYLSPTELFTIRNPHIAGLSPASGSPGTEITVDGSFFGGKKGKVYLVSRTEGWQKGCKVTSWYMDPTNGTNSQIKFLVPKVNPGDYWLYIGNKVGNSPIDLPYHVE